ncbi:ABC transporter permease [Peptostreptococcus faecalis]|uniref:ABC transporter permease n=1 Tax=Peptostreptococcus faecalis TaxID=2045015 RepID=UPI000C7AE638|nr:ABC transporter permease [Peptostreptococcus faecalis]
MIDVIMQNYDQLILKIGEHLLISFLALLLGVVVAVPIGVVLVKNKKMSSFVISIASILQTIPSLALLAIMVPIFGIGKTPGVFAIFIYSLLPILRNTYLGMDGVDKDTLDAAKGMGMTFWQRIISIQVPLAAPVIMSGIRLSAVYVISWTTLASYIGAGGLGDFIFIGLNTFNIPMIVMGAVPVTILALLVDFILGKIEKFVKPKTSSFNGKKSSNQDGDENFNNLAKDNMGEGC